jgi:DNA-binding GntR family transcriptional regulator
MALTESMTDALRRDILAGVFAPGERLIELQLTERYGVGRAAVRSALVELSTEGLVEREANRGAMVRRMSLADVIQITEARMALESLLAAHAAVHATAEERAELVDIELRMRDATARNAAADYSALNALFHRRVREISRHSVGAELVANLRNRAAHHQYRLAQLPGRSAASVEQHARIIQAITAGDPDAAADEMRAHLASVIEALQHWSDAGVHV